MVNFSSLVTKVLWFVVSLRGVLIFDEYMIIDSIQDVAIYPAGSYKYIVAEVSKGDNKKIIVRGSVEYEYHQDIFKNLKEEISIFDGVSASCLGGGRIKIVPEDKAIFLYGDSSRFGEEPDRRLTMSILQKSFPDFKIEKI